MRTNASPETVAPMLPGAPRAHIEANLPHVLSALEAVNLDDKPMVLMALATIRAETGSFQPISEGMSKYNSTRTPTGHAFDRYDNMPGLGNLGPPDGERFKGRGFVQLTGRNNYATHGQAIGLGSQLIDNPELANGPAIAARLLASFLKRKEAKIRAALSTNDLAAARKLVNGGTHGLQEFTAAFQAGQNSITSIS